MERSEEERSEEKRSEDEREEKERSEKEREEEEREETEGGKGEAECFSFLFCVDHLERLERQVHEVGQRAVVALAQHHQRDRRRDLGTVLPTDEGEEK